MEKKNKIYMGLIFNEIVLLNQDKQIIERIKLRTIKDHIKLLSEEKTHYEKEIEEKYADSKIIYLFEKENHDFELNHEMLDVLLSLNEKNLKEIKSNYKEILEEQLKNFLTEDKIIILLYDTLNHYEKIINENVIRLKELAVYVYPGVYEQYHSNDQFVRDISNNKLRYNPIFNSIIEDKQYITLINDLSKNIHEIIQIKNRIEKMIEKNINRLMPNTTYLIGAKLTSKLLSEIGSLEKLAYAPSSTIQVIGAEKSLFKHLLGRGKSPKHGIIFLSEYIQKAPLKHRGKIARVLSLKISKAAKIDYFSKGKEFIGDKLKKELEEYISSLK